MKIKNFIPYSLASLIYSSKYALLIMRGYNKKVKNLVNTNDLFYGELYYVYYLAMYHENKDIINFLETDFKELKFYSKENLFLAAEKNNTNLIAHYLLVKKPNKKNKFLFTLLETANLYNRLETVELLLNYGVDFKQNNYTCIRSLKKTVHFNMFKLYHKYGLDINKNEYMFCAILNDNIEWYYYLLKNGFVIDEYNEKLIKSFIVFRPSLSILDAVKEDFINDDELLKKMAFYNPLTVEWVDNFLNKVSFYNKIKVALPLKDKSFVKKDVIKI